MEPQGVIFDIKHYAVHDGPGIRTTVFFKGCPLNCWWCHNPESQNIDPEEIKISDKNYLLNDSETLGVKKSLTEVMKEIHKDRIYYEESNGGVTFSGGEPLFQIDFLLALLKDCKASGYHTAVDTAGCTNSSVLMKIIDYVDLFLYDLKLIDDNKHKEYTGQSNKQILDNLRLLIDEGKEVIIRIPIIPTINDSKIEIEKFGKTLIELKISSLELLPFHKIGEEKYRRLNKLNRMKDIQPPTKERMKEIKSQFEKFGFHVKIEE